MTHTALNFVMPDGTVFQPVEGDVIQSDLEAMPGGGYRIVANRFVRATGEVLPLPTLISDCDGVAA